MTAIDALLEKAAAGAALTDGERSALLGTPDLLGLGMAADEARRRRHGRRMTFVRVATLDINTVDAMTTWPETAGEVRIAGTPTDWTAAIASVRMLTERAAGRVPITGFSLVDLETAGAPMLAQLKSAGLAAVGDAPIDRLADPDAALSMANDAGLAVLSKFSALRTVWLDYTVTSEEARERLAAEINRIISNAARAGSVVRTGYYAGMLADAYWAAGFSLGHIVDAIAEAASKRGIPVEIARSDSSRTKPVSSEHLTGLVASRKHAAHP